jgi:hypothetical protein
MAAALHAATGELVDTANQVPAKGLSSGDLVEIEFQIDDGRMEPTDINQVYIPYGTAH